jgi:hypothetical protein
MVENWASGLYKLVLRDQISSENNNGVNKWRVDVIEILTGLLVKSLVYCQSKYRLARLIASAWVSGVNALSVPDKSERIWSKAFTLNRGEFGYVVLPTVFSRDPLSPTADESTEVVQDGTLIQIVSSVSLTVGELVWYKVIVNGESGWVLSPDGSLDFIALVNTLTNDQLAQCETP